MGVGDAQVIFSNECVTPLLRIDNMPRNLYRWPSTSGPPAGNLAETFITTWQSGNPNTSGISARMPQTSRHELMVHRSQARRGWQTGRSEARAAKASLRC